MMDQDGPRLVGTASRGRGISVQHSSDAGLPATDLFSAGPARGKGFQGALKLPG